MPRRVHAIAPTRRTRQSERIHVAEEADVALTDADDRDWDGYGGKNGPLGRVPPPVAVLQHLGEKAKFREG